MTDSGSGSPTLVYPAPTVVVGVGRLGLAVLERLGEDWRTLSLAGGDASLANLRLIHLRPEAESEAPDEDDDWRGEAERQAVEIARRMGESDLPSLALNLVILRCMGLIRFRDGQYQVAVPQDRGWVEVERDPGDGSAVTKPGRDGVPDVREGIEKPRLERRRFFDWRDLGPDPVAAAERLHRLAERISDLDLFITPILSRVRQGHSPTTLLACLRRALAFSQGRDPSPWQWLEAPLQAEEAELGEYGEVRLTARTEDEAERLFGKASCPPDESEETKGSYRAESLADYAPPPLEEDRWKDWESAGLGESVSGGVPKEQEPLEVLIPGPFIPHPFDPKAPIQPRNLLAVDWETSGWAAEGIAEGDFAHFRPVPVSPFRLGLFDHDGTRRGKEQDDDALIKRLECLAPLIHQGLVRLWVDLQRERVEERLPHIDDRRRDTDEDALRQSLEILGELTVGRPVMTELFSVDGAAPPGSSESPAGLPRAPEDTDLPGRPSKFLRGLRLERRPGDLQTSALHRRLAALGLDDGDAPHRRNLLHEVALRPEDVMVETSTQGLPQRSEEEERKGLRAFGRILNHEVRDLFDIRYLSSYRDWPTRRPPRLTVFLVGDMGEVFVRSSMRPLLQEVHAELLRAFGPFLEFFRESFDRGLSVLPILWMPHPADPFEGRAGQELPRSSDRCEEAAIIDAVQGIRRWVESVIPPTRRRVSQIFINSRVTDSSVVPLSEAIRQTRDFVNLLIRNEVGRHDFLRTMVEGPGSDDFFSSFTCYEIDFPAEKAREYLANRFGRDNFQALLEPQRTPRRSSSDEEEGEKEERLFAAPALDLQLDSSRAEIQDSVAGPAETVARGVESHCSVDRETPPAEICDAFDRGYGRLLEAEVRQEWQRLKEREGIMDKVIGTLRRTISHQLDERVREVTRESDRLIEEYAAEGGLQRALAGFQDLRRRARRALQGSEKVRLQEESLARRHDLQGSLAGLQAARRDIHRAAHRKPELDPIRWGLVLWLGLSLPLGATLAHGLAQLRQWPFFLELALNGLPGMVIGWLGLFLLGGWAVLRFLDRRTAEVRIAIGDLAEAVRRLFRGRGGPPEDDAPSLASFLVTRLRHSRGLAERGFCLRIYDRLRADVALAERIQRSVQIQLHKLVQQSEELGVRPRLAEGPEARSRDDLSRLFATRQGEPVDRLIDSEELEKLYEREVGLVEDLVPRMSKFLERLGGFGEWRETACLADSQKVLEVGRQHFGSLVRVPLPDQPFADVVGERLCRFVARLFPNLGFGARFAGYEGLDPDGVQVQAEVALVLHPSLARVFRQTRESFDRRESDPWGEPSLRRQPRITSAMDLESVQMRPNAAYMLSLAQGIRAHSVRNLKRFESYHGRLHMPYDCAFPMTHEASSGDCQVPITQLSRASEIGRELRRRLSPEAALAGTREGRKKEP